MLHYFQLTPNQIQDNSKPSLKNERDEMVDEMMVEMMVENEMVDEMK